MKKNEADNTIGYQGQGSYQAIIYVINYMKYQISTFIFKSEQPSEFVVAPFKFSLSTECDFLHRTLILIG